MASCLNNPRVCESEATPTSLTPREELELAKSALPGLWVFDNSEFVEREVNLTLSM